MDILMLLIPLSVVLVFVIAFAFAWSVRHGQFDDLEGPAWRILGDDDRGAPDASVAPSTGARAPKGAPAIPSEERQSATP